jgi:hypothetical protein
MTEDSHTRELGEKGRLLFWAVGVCALCFGVWQAWEVLRLLQSAVRTQGIILADILPDGTPSPTGVGRPLVEFTTHEGRVIRYRQNGMGATPPGVQVPVLYLAEDPQESAKVDRPWVLWVPVVWPLFMGLGFIVLMLLGATVQSLPGRW